MCGGDVGEVGLQIGCNGQNRETASATNLGLLWTIRISNGVKMGNGGEIPQDVAVATCKWEDEALVGQAVDRKTRARFGLRQRNRDCKWKRGI